MPHCIPHWIGMMVKLTTEGDAYLLGLNPRISMLLFPTKTRIVSSLHTKKIIKPHCIITKTSYFTNIFTNFKFQFLQQIFASHVRSNQPISVSHDFSGRLQNVFSSVRLFNSPPSFSMKSYQVLETILAATPLI